MKAPQPPPPPEPGLRHGAGRHLLTLYEEQAGDSDQR